MSLNKFKTILFAAVLTISSVTSLPVFADENDEVLWQDQTSIYHKIVKRGDKVVIIQRNKLRDSEVCASTIGYQITDTATNQTENVPLDDRYVVQHQGPVEISEKGYRYVEIESEFSSELSAKILNSLAAQNGSIQLDNVMAVSSDGGKTKSSIWDEATQSWVKNREFETNGLYAAAILKASGGDGAFGYGEAYAFAYQTYGWADKKGWYTNFVKKLILDGVKLESMNLEDFENWLEAHPEIPTPDEYERPPVDPDEDVIYRQSSNGQIQFYNDSRNYEEDGSHKGFADAFDTDANGSGIIIPSSEKYLTGIKSRTYAGTVAIGLGGAEHTFSYSEFEYTSTVICFWVDYSLPQGSALS